MFQFSQVIKENESDYDVNAYALEEALPIEPVWNGETVTARGGAGASGGAGALGTADGIGGDESAQERFVVFCGSEDGDVFSVVRQWCAYTRRNLVLCGSAEEYAVQEGCLPEAFLVDSESVDLTENLEGFYGLTDFGITMIFCNLPDVSVVSGNEKLQKLLGIQQIPMEEVEVEGICLLEDFLLGGEVRYLAEREEDEKYQDLELTVPWYVPAGGTKTYMMGILDEFLEEYEEKNEYFPALIWRNGYGQSKIFSVNGDYMSDMTGIGMLEGMMYEADSYDVYPVVNAQNVIVTNYPQFAGENDEVMMELYSRSTRGVLRDICWPDLSSLVERNKLRLTCMFAPQYDYRDGTEPSGEEVPFYLQQLKEAGAEAGLSLSHWEEVSLEEKLQRDGEFYRSLEERYQYSAAFAERETLESLGEVQAGAPLLSDVRTVAWDCGQKEAVVSWRDRTGGGTSVTLQGVTSDAKSHTYSEDLYVRSMETALGYSNVRIDMHDVVWPESEEDQWEKMYDKISGNMNTYWRIFSAFSKTTLTESDRRIRNFLNLDYRDWRQEDRVYLEVSGAEEGWFILRVHGEEIVSAEGTEYQEIEGGAYLLHVTEGQAVVSLRRSRGILEYTYP